MWWIITAALLRHGVIWFSIGSSGAVRSCTCRSDSCNSGVITCVVWLLTTVVISCYVLCMPVYVCIGLLVMCGTLACVYSGSGAGVTVCGLSYIICGIFYTYLVILMLVESRAGGVEPVEVEAVGPEEAEG